jgi:Uma2 family endonuclease
MDANNVVDKTKVRRNRKVKDALVYEIMDGKPIYYKGYKSVLNKTKKPEDIMGSSLLQGIILNFVVYILHKHLNPDDFWVVINEPGIHLDYKNNLSGDILIYEKSRLNALDIKNRYANLPANVVVEVDTKADLTKQSFDIYLKSKTSKLHAFGVDKVIWIFTTSKQVVVAIAGNDWLMIDWNKEIEIMPGVSFNIGEYLTKNGIEVLDVE